MNTRSVVMCRTPSSNDWCPIEFDCAPDCIGARRWVRTFRRIDRVEFERHGHGWRCAVRGIGHRLPVRQVAPLRVGVGLAHLGLPALVVDRAEVS